MVGPRKTVPLLAIAALPFLPPPSAPPGTVPPDEGNGFPKVGAAVFLDGAGTPDARQVWGSADCERAGRVRRTRFGGDSTTVADGRPQDSSGFRRVRVVDGDDYSGERCELGLNDHRTSPVALYRDGARLITYLSLKLSKQFPIRGEGFQVVAQMKQTQPADTGGGIPMLALQARDRRWRLDHPGSEGGADLWSAPAVTGRWVRFAFEVTYSADPTIGSVRISADLNGDGDALDLNERSARFAVPTLKVEGPGGTEDGLAPGDPIPSHLRVGIYHDAGYPCVRDACSVGVDNVGIFEPAP
jgi:hypothetical protein